ncbi:MAG: hypothetical protein ABI821_11545 [Pseudomonadota bacterium]
MKNRLRALALLGSWAGGWICGGNAWANNPSPVVVEIVTPDGRVFQEFPLNTRDGSWRSYLQAEKGARYEVRVRNTTGSRLGLVIAVDGRNIINGEKSALTGGEPMYVLDGWDSQKFAGWRANLDAINEFYFTEWSDSYAEAFGDRSARGVIAIAVYREVAPPPPVYQPHPDEERSLADAAPAASAPQKAESRSRADSAGTGYGDRRIDRVVQVEFVARSDPDSRHFIKYEWRDALCRKRVLECGEPNRFWDESTLSFARPPPRH